MSRRRFLQATAGTLGALSSGLLLPGRSLAAGRDPKPMPGGFNNPAGGPFLHLNLPGHADAVPVQGNASATITDFDGYIGNARIQGTGHAGKPEGDNSMAGPLKQHWVTQFAPDYRKLPRVNQSVVRLKQKKRSQRWRKLSHVSLRRLIQIRIGHFR